MESESGENVGFFWVLRKPLLLLFCGVSIVQRLSNLLYDVIWSLHSSATPRYYQNILLSYPPEKKKRMRITRLFFVTDLEKESVQQRIKEIIW